MCVPIQLFSTLLLFEFANAAEEGEGNDDEDPPHAHARRAASTDVGAVWGGDLMRSREIGAPYYSLSRALIEPS